MEREKVKEGIGDREGEEYIIETETDWAWHGLLKPQNPPPVSHLLQQSYVSYNKAIPPKSRPHLLIH